MRVLITLSATPAKAVLEAPSDCKKFHVVAQGGDVAALADALVSTGAGRMAGEDVAVDVGWVRAQATGRVGPEWDADFAAMLGYAESKGWMIGDVAGGAGGAIQAHVEWA